MQIEWARQLGERTLILAPLAVAQQTVREGVAMGIPVTYARSQAAAAPNGITITNYEMLGHFDPAAFGAVVLDESGILKNYSGVVKRSIIAAFRQTPYRLSCTATPAPNDAVELCNQADFLGVMTPAEMISTFFTPKGQDSAAGNFRIKGHAREAFFRWLASWSMSLFRPSDLGYSDEGFELPPLRIHPHIVTTDWAPEGALLFTGLKGVTHRAGARRATLTQRVEEAVSLVHAEPGVPWLLWCGLNAEANLLQKMVPAAVNVEGSQSPEVKAEALLAFATGETRYLITKCGIAGFGMNFQRCSHMAFVGLGDSFEQYFQAIRRCWRFGQTEPVDVHIVLSEVEAAVYENVLRKEKEHEDMMQELRSQIGLFERAAIVGRPTINGYHPERAFSLPGWL